MNILTNDIINSSLFNEIFENIEKEGTKTSLNNIVDSQKAFYIYNLTKKSTKSSIIVCSNNITANKMIQDLKFFSDLEIIYFPAKPVVYYDLEAQSKEVQNDRMYALSKLKENTKKIIVTTIDALLLPMPDQNTSSSILVKLDKNVDPIKLTQDLINMRL